MQACIRATEAELKEFAGETCKEFKSWPSVMHILPQMNEMNSNIH